MKNNSKVKMILTGFCVFLLFSLVMPISIDLHSSAQTINEEVVYITDKAFENSSTSVKVNNSIKNVKLKKIELKNINQLDTEKTKNVIADAELANKKEVKDKLNKCLEGGSKIIIRKNDITKEEVFKYFNINTNKLDYSNGNDNSLKVIGEMIVKDVGKNIYSNTISVEDYTNEAAVLDAMNFAFASGYYEKYILKENIRSSAIKTGYVVKASNLTWTPVYSFGWTDGWNACTLQHSNVLQKNPYNPSNGQYYSILYTPIVIQPNSSFSTGRSYFYHTGSGSTKILDLGPKPQSDATTFSFCISFPSPSLQFSGNFGSKFDYNISGGLGQTYVQWNYTPKVFSFYPTTSCTNFELTSEYYGSSSYYKGGFSYTVNTYYNKVDGTYSYYGDASKSGRYVGGY